MAKFYIQTIKNGIEYDIPENVIETIRLAYDLGDTEIVFCATIPEEDKVAASEGRALQFEAVRDIAKDACKTELTVKATESPVTNETPVETPEENGNTPEEEEIKMTKMPKELGKAIRVAVSKIINKYAQPLTKLKNVYETARDTLKKTREKETDTVKAAKDTYDTAEKGTVARKIAALDLKAARDHKKVVVGEAKLNYDTAKLDFDKLVADMNDAVAEVTRSLIGEYQPVTAILSGSAADDKTADEPAKKEPAAKEQTTEEPAKKEPTENKSAEEKPSVTEIVEDEVGGTDFSTDDKTGDDKPADTSLPKKTFAVLSFGNVGNKVEAFRTKILASNKYAWKEVQDWKQADLIRVYTQAGAKVTKEERAELEALIQAGKAAPDRVHFDRVNA